MWCYMQSFLMSFREHSVRLYAQRSRMHAHFLWFVTTSCPLEKGLRVGGLVLSFHKWLKSFSHSGDMVWCHRKWETGSVEYDGSNVNSRRSCGHWRNKPHSYHNIWQHQSVPFYGSYAPLEKLLRYTVYILYMLSIIEYSNA